MGIKSAYQNFRGKLLKQARPQKPAPIPKSKVQKMHEKMTACFRHENPHQIYLTNNFLLTEIKELKLEDLKELNTNFLNWHRYEQGALRTLIYYKYAQNITNRKVWMSVLYQENFKSLSENTKTLDSYYFILENEHSDTDFWWNGGGNELIFDHLEDNLTESDWEDLANDLSNWTENQLSIFTYCIIEGEGRFDKGDYTGSIVQKRFDLLQTLFKIAEGRYRVKAEINEHLWDNLEFINKGPAKSKDSLLGIAKFYGYSKEAIYGSEIEMNALVIELKKALEIAV